jgi:hypothetical protein
MRNEAKIKEAFLHPDQMVRQEALHYFADCHSRDTEVMPLVIQALEKYGPTRAFPHLYLLAHLAQTEATVAWATQELHGQENSAEKRESYFPSLSQLLCSAETRLLVPRIESVLRAPEFSHRLRPELQDSLRLAEWDADQCWRELERVCAAGVGKTLGDDFDFAHARRVVVALAGKRETDVERLLDLLGKEIVDFETDPMTWLEIFLVQLAGEMRLEGAIPLIVKKLHACGEILSEQCVEALGKIGTDAAAEAVSEGWLDAVWDYRLYATSALAAIHSDTTLQKCVELLRHERDPSIKTHLADALLSQFAEEAIDPVREMVRQNAYEAMDSHLPGKLIAVSTVLGVTFPELTTWKQAAEKKRFERQQMMQRIQPVQSAPTKQPPATSSAERRGLLDRRAAPLLNAEERVGRNDLCPCGSGKKFKKCCINRGK